MIHINKVKEIISVQNKIENIDLEILEIEKTVAKVSKLNSDAVINMHLQVSNVKDSVDEKISFKIESMDDITKFTDYINKVKESHDKSTNLSYVLSESDLLRVFSVLMEGKKQERQLYINELEKLGVTYELPKGRSKKIK
jgi:hypothetical protein